MQELRNEIDAIDNQLVELFKKRMATSAKIADYKRVHKLPVLDPERERQLLKRIAGLAGEDLAPSAKTLYKTLLSLSRLHQNRLLHKDDKDLATIRETIAAAEKPLEFPTEAVVACQGTEGSFSTLAAERFFKEPSPMFFNRFEKVFQAVDKGLCHYGILPIENSTAGAVNQVYDLMREYRFHIVRSAKLCVSHTLLALPGATLDGIKTIFSHEHAYQQCSDFFQEHPGIKFEPVANTAIAAKQVAASGRHDIAAIASHNCAEIYGLIPLLHSMQNRAYNVTRFICISKKPEIFPGADRTSFVLTLPHRSGSLYNVMALLASYDVNLQKLESRPVPGSDFAFMFYFDMDASPLSPDFLPMMESIRSLSETFTYLGSYLELG